MGEERAGGKTQREKSDSGRRRGASGELRDGGMKNEGDRGRETEDEDMKEKGIKEFDGVEGRGRREGKTEREDRRRRRRRGASGGKEKGGYTSAADICPTW